MGSDLPPTSEQIFFTLKEISDAMRNISIDKIDFEEKTGLEFDEVSIIDGEYFYVYHIVDKEKWFLAKIQYGV